MLLLALKTSHNDKKEPYFLVSKGILIMLLVLSKNFCPFNDKYSLLAYPQIFFRYVLHYYTIQKNNFVCMFYTFIYCLIVSRCYPNKNSHLFYMFSNTRRVSISEYVSLKLYEFSKTEESHKF